MHRRTRYCFYCSKFLLTTTNSCLVLKRQCNVKTKFWLIWGLFNSSSRSNFNQFNPKLSSSLTVCFIRWKWGGNLWGKGTKTFLLFCRLKQRQRDFFQRFFTSKLIWCQFTRNKQDIIKVLNFLDINNPLLSFQNFYVWRKTLLITVLYSFTNWVFSLGIEIDRCKSLVFTMFAFN